MDLEMGQVEELVERIRQCANAVIFSGAGISTQSGIPDFRSQGGFWTRFAPVEFRQYLSDPQARRLSWQRRFDMEETWGKAKPNEGHRAVADLVARSYVTQVITQNIDALHQASGIPQEKIIELHGNTHYAKCLCCGMRVEIDAIRAHFEAHGEPPDCRFCGGLIKTATISFGQAMPQEEMVRAEIASLACDLMLVLGSSLAVFPAAGFPLMAKRNGAGLVILNRDETPQDHYADMVFRGDIGPMMRAVVDAL